MFVDRRELPVFHEDNLEVILNKLNLLEKMQRNELLCSICNVIITKENFGCIYLNKDNNVEVCCSNPECFKKVSEEI